VHSHFLTTQSDVFDAMLAAPKDQVSSDGTELNPLILTGDRVEGWELLLSAIYRRYDEIRKAPDMLLTAFSNPLTPVKYTSRESIAVLRITHKYCMDIIEGDIVSGLKDATDTAGFIDLMIASQVVDSPPLYETALKGLIASRPKPTLGQAILIGVEAYHAIMSASTNDRDGVCNRCGFAGRLALACDQCGNYQYSSSAI
jgi:hypothetical protein